MKVATASEISAIDARCVQEIKMPTLLLMENAAEGVAEQALKFLEGLKEPKVIVFAGRGNNGGDGLAVARKLWCKKIYTGIVCAGNLQDGTEDFVTNANIALNMGIPINFVREGEAFIDIQDTIDTCDLIIDALFGAGLSRDISGFSLYLINLINASGKYVISVDIPSGVHADTGAVMGAAVKANETVAFSLYKRGHLLFPGADYCGKISIKEINIPKYIIDEAGIECRMTTAERVQEMIPQRAARSNKGSYGRVYIAAGSNHMPGAALLCNLSAYKTGAGLVYSYSTKEAADFIRRGAPEVIASSVYEEDGQFCKNSFSEMETGLNSADIVAVGPGIGWGDNVREFMEEILLKIKSPLIIDADGLNALSDRINILKKIQSRCIITPHPLEMSRLTRMDKDDILKDPIATAKNFSMEYGVITVLKDAHTIIASPDGEIFINTTGNAALAKAGSGDVLTGIIAGLCAQSMDEFLAAIAGVYIHGRAGELAARDMGLYGVTASDLTKYIPAAMNEIAAPQANEFTINLL